MAGELEQMKSAEPGLKLKDIVSYKDEKITLSLPAGTDQKIAKVAEKTGELARAAWTEIKGIYERR